MNASFIITIQDEGWYIVEIYCLRLPDEEDVRQKITKMMRDVTNPNKAPPRAAPTMIPGEGSTRGNELLCIHSVLIILCLFQIKMIKVNLLGLWGFYRPWDSSDPRASAHQKYTSRNYYILDRNLRVVFRYYLWNKRNRREDSTLPQWRWTTRHLCAGWNRWTFVTFWAICVCEKSKYSDVNCSTYRFANFCQITIFTFKFLLSLKKKEVWLQIDFLK